MKPLICVPMGDPAGVGPEIVAASAVDPLLRGKARIVAVGNGEILRRAAEAMNVAPVINRVDADLSGIREDALNLVHMDNLPLSSFAHGVVDGMCGRAAYEYIAKAVELAAGDKVDAIATAPINKESLKAAKVPHIGHTEILAELTDSHDPLTLFQVHSLRVFFLTRHMSLARACKSVTRERTLDYIRRCSAVLNQLGIENPKMIVAGLNPHCGENGLFGDEEVRELAPAVADAQREGYAVSGPSPADSVFHFALHGSCDAVISLYHDQGHIATKMVDFERTIALTLGLPFLRTSVDHGTAFDIAGKGRVSAVSMVEAIRLAALYAPNFKKNLQVEYH